MCSVDLPDLTEYRLHRVADEADFEGTAVPGLSAEFYRRDEDGRLASVGRYAFDGRTLLLAWGYVDEEHCRFSAVAGVDGAWQTPVPGCPEVRVLRDGDAVSRLTVRGADGAWVSASAASPAPASRTGGQPTARRPSAPER